MKTRFRKPIGALTLIELLVVIAVIAILAAIVLPMFSYSEPPSRTVRCMIQQKQIGVACLIYATEHSDTFPMSRGRLAISNYPSNQMVATAIKKLSFVLADTRILICPFDSERHPAASTNSLADTNISYFLNCDAATNGQSTSIMAGDRFVRANDRSLEPGLFLLTTNLNLSWTPDRHFNRGNLAFADGHVETTKTNLNSIIRNQPLATNLLAIP